MKKWEKKSESGSKDGNAFGFLSIDGFKLSIINLFWQPLENHFTILERNCAGGVPMHQIEEMQTAYNGNSPFLIELFKIFQDGMCQYRIKRSDRLIRQDQLGFLHKCTRDPNALLLASRERVGANMRFIDQTNLFQTGQCPLVIFARK